MTWVTFFFVLGDREKYAREAVTMPPPLSNVMVNLKFLIMHQISLWAPWCCLILFHRIMIVLCQIYCFLRSEWYSCILTLLHLMTRLSKSLVLTLFHQRLASGMLYQILSITLEEQTSYKLKRKLFIVSVSINQLYTSV